MDRQTRKANFKKLQLPAPTKLRSTRSNKAATATLTLSNYFNTTEQANNAAPVPEEEPSAASADPVAEAAAADCFDEPVTKKSRETADFEKPGSKPKKAPKLKSGGASRRGRSKKQPSISDFLRNEQIFAEVAAQHAMADNFSPDDIEMALALSKSEAEKHGRLRLQETQQQEEEEVVDMIAAETTTESIRRKLQKYGFRTAAKEDYSNLSAVVMPAVGKRGKRGRWANKFTPLTLRTLERQQQKLEANVAAFLQQQVRTRELSAEERLMPPYEFISKSLKTLAASTENCINREPSEASISNLADYYVTELFEVSETPADHLLKNWAAIQGRDLSPERRSEKSRQRQQQLERVYVELEKHFKDIVAAEEEAAKQEQDEMAELDELEKILAENMIQENDSNKTLPLEEETIPLDLPAQQQAEEKLLIENIPSIESPLKEPPDKRAKLAEKKENINPSFLLLPTPSMRCPSPDIFADSDEEDETMTTVAKPIEEGNLELTSYEVYSSDEAKTVCDATAKLNKPKEIQEESFVDLTQDDESPEMFFSATFKPKFSMVEEFFALSPREEAASKTEEDSFSCTLAKSPKKPELSFEHIESTAEKDSPSCALANSSKKQELYFDHFESTAEKDDLSCALANSSKKQELWFEHFESTAEKDSPGCALANSSKKQDLSFERFESTSEKDSFSRALANSSKKPELSFEHFESTAEKDSFSCALKNSFKKQELSFDNIESTAGIDSFSQPLSNSFKKKKLSFDHIESTAEKDDLSCALANSSKEQELSFDHIESTAEKDSFIRAISNSYNKQELSFEHLKSTAEKDSPSCALVNSFKKQELCFDHIESTAEDSDSLSFTFTSPAKTNESRRSFLEFHITTPNNSKLSTRKSLGFTQSPGFSIEDLPVANNSKRSKRKSLSFTKSPFTSPAKTNESRRSFPEFLITTPNTSKQSTRKSLSFTQSTSPAKTNESRRNFPEFLITTPNTSKQSTRKSLSFTQSTSPAKTNESRRSFPEFLITTPNTSKQSTKKSLSFSQSTSPAKTNESRRSLTDFHITPNNSKQSTRKSLGFTPSPGFSMEDLPVATFSSPFEQSQKSIDLTGNSSDEAEAEADNEGILLSDDEINYSIWQANKTFQSKEAEKRFSLAEPAKEKRPARQCFKSLEDLDAYLMSELPLPKANVSNCSSLSKEREEFGILDAAPSQPFTFTQSEPETSPVEIDWASASFLDTPNEAPLKRYSSGRRSHKFDELLDEGKVAEPPNDEFDEFDRLVFENPAKDDVPSGLDRLLKGDINWEAASVTSKEEEAVSLNGKLKCDINWELPTSKEEKEEAVPEQLQVNGKLYQLRVCHSPKPDFTRLTESELLKQLYNYGIKPLKRKQAVKMLEFIYNQTHPLMLPEEKEQQEQPQAIKALPRSKSTPACEFLNPSQPIGEGKLELIDAFGAELLRFSQSQPPALCDDFEHYVLQTNVSKKTPQPLTPLHIAWHNLLCANPRLHESVLLYEPIDLQEIYLHFKQRGQRFDPKDLKCFFDRRCIIFRYELAAAPGKQPAERHTRKKPKKPASRY